MTQAELRDKTKAARQFSTFSSLDEAGVVWEQLQRDEDAPDIGALFTGYRAWVTQFSGPNEPPLLHLSTGGRSLAILPVRLQRSSFAGLGLRSLRSPSNFCWTSGYPIIRAGAAEGIAMLLSELIQRSDWDILELGPMGENHSVVAEMFAHGQRLGMRPTISSTVTDHFVTVDGDWQGYYAGRSANVRSMLARGERRLACNGPLRFGVCKGGDTLSGCLDEFFRIEASGWKGKEGTAIDCDPATRAFYTDLASLAAARGWFRLFLLHAGDVCVAGEYCLELNGNITMLKSGYDDGWSKASPGHVLKKLLLKQLFDSGRKMTYGMGTVGSKHMSYKRMWATDTRNAVIMRLFNPGRIRSRLARAFFDLKRRASVVRARARRSALRMRPAAQE